MRKLIVVGNPPYQINDDTCKKTTHSSALYHLFVEAIIDNICPDYFSFIIPSRWMVGGRGLDNHRERMMNDRRMKKIVHFPKPRELFTSVGIAGGVNYFLWEKNHDGMCEFIHENTCHARYLNQYDIILQDNNAYSILQKISNTSNSFMNKDFAIQNPFGILTNFNDWQKEGVICHSRGNIVYHVDNIHVNDKHNISKKWKACTSKATSEGNLKGDNNGMTHVINNIFIIEPDAVCTQTYIVVNVFDTKKEAEHFITYMKTKFFRFMLGLRVLTQDINKEKFAWVPDVEDYSAPWTDQELYKKFGLTRQEIAYIESKIKAIN